MKDETVVSVCLNSFKNLFGIFRRQWEYLRKNCSTTNYTPGPIQHGNIGNENRKRSSAVESVASAVVDFLEEIQETCAEPYATRFVREITGMSLRESEEGAVELPASYTKRKLYRDFCFSRGYKVKSDANGSFGKVKNYALRPFDDLLWPEGSEPLPVCSWNGFLRVWKEKFPKLTIRNPCEDTCGACTKIRNKFHIVERIRNARVAAAARENVDGNSSSSDEDCNSNAYSFDGAVEYDFLNRQEYPEEVIIMEASLHATQAQTQRDYAKLRIQESKDSSLAAFEERRFVFFLFPLSPTLHI
jgi:hypothetical protein